MKTRLRVTSFSRCLSIVSILSLILFIPLLVVQVHADDVEMAFGPEFTICIPTGSLSVVRDGVIYDPVNNRFLVLLSGAEAPGTDPGNIYGQLVNSDGSLCGGRIDISTASGQQSRPSAAFDPVTQRFLVIWEDFRHFSPNRWSPEDLVYSGETFGRLINSDGTLYGDEFIVNSSSPDLLGYADPAGVVYDNKFFRFFVTIRQHTGYGRCEDHAHKLYGRFVNGSGSFEGDYFPLNNDSYAWIYPYFAPCGYDPSRGRFLVLYTYNTSRTPAGLLINADGTQYMEFILEGLLEGNSFGVVSDVSFDSYNKKFFLSWQRSEYGLGFSGLLMNADGMLFIPTIVHEAPFLSQFYYKSVFDTGNNKFMLLTKESSEGGNLYLGQYIHVLDPAGKKFGSLVQIPGTTQQEIFTTLAFGSPRSGMLMVGTRWSESGTASIVGRFAKLKINRRAKMITGAFNPVIRDGREEVMINFGLYGIWMLNYEYTWLDIHPLGPEAMHAVNLSGSGPDNIIVDFGAPHGIWIRYANAEWSQLHYLSPKLIAVGDLDGNHTDDVIIDFGEPYGIWIYYNNFEWYHLHPLSPASMTTGDLDGNGADDVIIDFGEPYGIWIRYNDYEWRQLHSVPSQSMVSADLDGNGKDEIIIDFGEPYGIWAYLDDGTWRKVHDTSL